jgi:hypothetical protein
MCSVAYRRKAGFQRGRWKQRLIYKVPVILLIGLFFSVYSFSTSLLFSAESTVDFSPIGSNSDKPLPTIVIRKDEVPEKKEEAFLGYYKVNDKIYDLIENYVVLKNTSIKQQNSSFDYGAFLVSVGQDQNKSYVLKDRASSISYFKGLVEMLENNHADKALITEIKTLIKRLA